MEEVVISSGDELEVKERSEREVENRGTDVGDAERKATWHAYMTEVEFLPSISGYPLLTLIMEHEICKNIPVIMMSTQDSISTVYKCMLRGAADYLVKPLRKNELRNLWQHVWRRQSESVGQDKIEATSENSPASNHASGEMAPLLRSKGQTEKGSDAQSSCTKPDLEAESTHMENIPEFLQPVWSKFSLTDMSMQKREMHVNLGQKLLLHDREAEASHEDANKMDVDKENSPGNGRTDATESCDNDVALANSHIEAFDFMGASTNRNTEERQSLQHSNASAFTRYINRPLQLPHSALETPSTQKSDNSLDAGQTKESEIATSSPGQKVFPIQIPAKETRFNNLCNSYGSVLPPIFFKQSGLSPMMSPGSACQQEPTYKVNQYQHLNHGSTSEQLYDRIGQHANDSTNGSLQKQENRLDSLEDRGLISPALIRVHLGYGSTSGSNGNVDQVAIVRAASENEEGVFTHSYSHRSIQREAALTKFRLKRKERCYEKKVRYESRKKLAEQRPRVKGQFVRQMHIDPHLQKLIISAK
uniref:CCT domain-containing protein n=1 Tax=Salix viminalis TaxID=40686 RepID=A0A6N2LMS2_SALVM